MWVKKEKGREKKRGEGRKRNRLYTEKLRCWNTGKTRQRAEKWYSYREAGRGREEKRKRGERRREEMGGGNKGEGEGRERKREKRKKGNEKRRENRNEKSWKTTGICFILPRALTISCPKYLVYISGSLRTKMPQKDQLLGVNHKINCFSRWLFLLLQRDKGAAVWGSLPLVHCMLPWAWSPCGQNHPMLPL